MKPIQIKSVLDLARRARKQNRVFNPLFNGAPGLAKSFIVKQWCEENSIPFIDFRAALIEPPDVVGYPIIEKIDGKQRMHYATPDIWPTGGEGVIFLDEVNRGQTGVMNAFMQLLTDRKIFQYTLPPGWIIVAAINPENEANDVNSMDAAFKDRFEIFDITYDKKSFLDYQRTAGWDKYITMFIESGLWNYVLPEKIGDAAEGTKYVSPRTWEKVDVARKAGFLKEDGSHDEELEWMIYQSILGKLYGQSFYNFLHKEYPILVSDLKRDLKESLKMLNKYSDKNNYKASYISLTIKSLVDEKIDDMDLVSSVLLNIPSDQGMTLINELSFVLNKNLLDVIRQNYPKVQKHISSELK